MTAALREPFSYRDDPSVPAFPDDRAIIVFDGNCVLCSAFARFVVRYDRTQRFRLLPAQSPLGAAIYSHYNLHPTDYETNLLIENGRAWLKSEGSIRMFEGLGFPWSLATIDVCCRVCSAIGSMTSSPATAFAGSARAPSA